MNNERFCLIWFDIHEIINFVFLLKKFFLGFCINNIIIKKKFERKNNQIKIPKK